MSESKLLQEVKILLTEPVSFNATIWKQGEIFIIRIDKKLAQKFDLLGLDVRVTIDPTTYTMGTPD